MKDYLNLLRYKDYVKNLFVFSAIFFSGNIFDVDLLQKSGLLFVLFSLVASSVYIFNDIQDVASDKLHPTKKYRAIAAEKVSIKKAYWVAACLLVIAFSISFLLKKEVSIILALYLFINILYSKWLKNYALLDLVIIAIGFLLRIYIGGIECDIEISKWLVIMVFVLALFLGLCKRRDDVLIYLKDGKIMRKNVVLYSLEFLNHSIVLMSAVIIVCYLMYITSAENVARFNHPYLYLSSIFVILGVLKYLHLTFVEEQSGSPVTVLLKSRFIQFLILSWALFFGICIYY